MRAVAFLRGINVGGRNKVPMAALREIVGSLGLTDVRTHLQSGNVVFTSAGGDGDAVARAVEAAVRDALGVESRVLVRTGDAMRAVVAGNPLPEAVDDPARFHVAFLEAPPDAERLASVVGDASGEDVVRAGDGVLYVWYRGGVHASKLAKTLDRRLGVATTSRNWNTVTKVLELLAPDGA